MLTGLLHCHGIHLLVPGLFPPIDSSMQLLVASETQCTIPTPHLVFVGNVFTPLVSLLVMECKLCHVNISHVHTGLD